MWCRCRGAEQKGAAAGLGGERQSSTGSCGALSPGASDVVEYQLSFPLAPQKQVNTTEQAKHTLTAGVVASPF